MSVLQEDFLNVSLEEAFHVSMSSLARIVQRRLLYLGHWDQLVLTRILTVFVHPFAPFSHNHRVQVRLASCHLDIGIGVDFDEVLDCHRVSFFCYCVSFFYHQEQ